MSLVDAIQYNEVPSYLIILQSLVDLIPVIFFLLGSIILLKTLYNKMVKGNYALLAAGSIMVVSAGVLKAIHKFVMGAFKVDYIILDKQFTPTQSLGFLLLFLALLGMFTPYNKKYTKVGFNCLPLLFIPLLTVTEHGLESYESTLPFIVIMIIGALGFLVYLIYISIRMKSKLSVILLIVASIAMLGMGYLSTKRDFNTAWIQISVNIVYQACFFVSTLLLKKKGLEKVDALVKAQ